MRVVNQITFEAKDDAEALRVAAERLGKDAVILSSRTERVGGFLGLFQHPVLKVTAGIIEDDDGTEKSKSKEVDEQTRRENLVAFQKLMEFKDRQSANANAKTGAKSPMIGGEGYRPLGTMDLGVPDTSSTQDKVQFSSEGVRSAYGLKDPNPPLATPQPAQLPQHASSTGAGSANAFLKQAITNAETPAAPVQAQAAQSDMLSAGEAKVLRQEITDLSQRVDSLIAALTAQKIAQPTAVPQVNTATGLDTELSPDLNFDEKKLARRLRDAEIEERYIRKLLANYSALPASGELGEKIPFEEWLTSQIPCSGDNGGDAAGGRKVMFLGPTGVGKTTTIAKLAAIQALWEHKNVLLLTSDTYRIAAVDQLRTYARILGVPIEVVFDAEAIPEILNGHENTDLVLMDTAGRSQRDRRNISIFEALYNAMQPDAVHLVLAANMKYRDMLDVVEHIPNIPVSHLIFTKLDETVSYGSLFNIQQVVGCPVSFLTGGQDVPKDIEMASGSRIVEFLLSQDTLSGASERNKLNERKEQL